MVLLISLYVCVYQALLLYILNIQYNDCLYGSRKVNGHVRKNKREESGEWVTDDIYMTGS